MNSSVGGSGHGGKRPGAGRPALQQKKILKREHQVAASRARWSAYEARQHLIELRAELFNPRGSSYSIEENKLALLFILDLMVEEKLNKTTACDQVAKRLHRDRISLHHLLNHFLEYEEVIDISSANRGRGSPLYIHTYYHLSSEHISSIGEFIITVQQEGSGSTTTSIAQHLKSTFDIDISRSTLTYTLHRLGYQFGPGHVISGNLLQDKTPRIRQFIVDYANALEAQEEGNSVIVYMDESYVNTRHALNSTWYDPSQPIGNKLVRGTGKGARLIIIHAITKYGLLHHSHEESATGTEQTAELVWSADKGAGNYHKNMDSNKFLLWLSNNLFPTFQLLFPSKKMVLVLDNASYHHARGPDFIDPYKMNKPKVIEKLLSYNITNIEVEREGRKVYMYSDMYDKRGGSKAPTLFELQSALANHLQDIGYLGKTEVQKQFESCGYTLIYTPPCMPQFQPIELIWAYVKRYVANQFKLGRSMSELREHTLQGFYGDNDKHAGVTPEFTLNVIEHVHGVINRYIKEDVQLDGTIDKLIVKSLTGEEDGSDIINDQVNELDTFMGEMEDEYEEESKMEDECGL